jgi:hypothetical protein
MMTVVYTTSGPLSTTIAVFRCSCGRQAVSAGLRTGSLPRGWTQTSTGDDGHLCPECARYSESLARSK